MSYQTTSAKAASTVGPDATVKNLARLVLKRTKTAYTTKGTNDGYTNLTRTQMARAISDQQLLEAVANIWEDPITMMISQISPTKKDHSEDDNDDDPDKGGETDNNDPSQHGEDGNQNDYPRGEEEQWGDFTDLLMISTAINGTAQTTTSMITATMNPVTPEDANERSSSSELWTNKFYSFKTRSEEIPPSEETTQDSLARMITSMGNDDSDKEKYSG
ncbi:MAG: hypothetical protein Q9217_003306 [Psora testacea]